MIGRRSPSLALALLCGVLVAGCGSSGSTTSSSTTASTPATTTTAAKTTSTAANTTSTTATTTSSSAAVADYVAVCKAIIARVPTLKASVKVKVEGICSKAASGDVAGARAAAKEVCVEVIDASSVSGVTKEKSLAACNAM
jgi:hypothetical protein